MLKLIICFIIVLLLYHSLILTLANTCHDEDRDFVIKQISGSKINKPNFSKNMEYPTINIKLDEPIPCGYYTAMSKFGKVTLVIGRDNRTLGSLNFVIFDPEIDKNDRFDLQNVIRIVNKRNEIINAFNRGCCN